MTDNLKDGVGKCSVPMWQAGCPAGHCDKDAYGKRPKCETWRNPDTGREFRIDGKYAGYVPDLACPDHGGPSRADVAHHGDPCMYCGVAHDDVPVGPCKERQKIWA